MPIHVREVAEVKEGPALRFGAVTRDGKEVALGIALARINENPKSVVDAVKQKLDLARQALPPGVSIKPVYDRTELVDKALATAESALVEGSILVAIVLFLFLGDAPPWRDAVRAHGRTAGRPATAPPYGFIPSAFARGSCAITSTALHPSNSSV